jgi:hypothetical protein
LDPGEIDTSVTGGHAQRIAHDQSQWLASRLSEGIQRTSQLGGNPHDNRTIGLRSHLAFQNIKPESE